MSSDTAIPILLVLAVISFGMIFGEHNNQESLEYINSEFGFTFELPSTWQGYGVLETVWEGHGVGGELQGKIVETGPKILLRHPLWTAEVPRQDIPIMIFTLEQWESMQQGKFHIGAAPIGPSMLGLRKSSRSWLQTPFILLKRIKQVRILSCDLPLLLSRF